MAISASVAGSQSLTATPSSGSKPSRSRNLTYKATVMGGVASPGDSLPIERGEITTHRGRGPKVSPCAATIPPMRTRTAQLMVGALLAAIIPSTIDIGTSASAAVPSCPSKPSQAASVPDDASLAQRRLGAQRANALADGSGVTVAVIASGVDPSQ